MAIKGLSIPVIGDYSVTDSGSVSYSNPAVADRAVEYSASWETTDDNPLYADNTIVEQDSGTFQSGTLTLGTADLPQSLSERILGLKKNVIKYANGKTVTELIYDDNAKSPYLGFGIIELHQIDNNDKYRAVFLPKIKFKIPEEAATTKGDSIDWQTKSIEASILRSDQSDDIYKNPWMIDAWFDSESEALVYLMYKCGATVSSEAEG
ncbi:MAG: major tail protein [Eubacterium sp.]